MIQDGDRDHNLGTFQKYYSSFPTYADQPFIRKHSYLGILVSFMVSSHQLQTLASMPQGGARGQNLGHLRNYFI